MGDGGEASRAVGYAGIGALVLGALDRVVKLFSRSQTTQSMELDSTLKASAGLRDELRKDLETMRAHVESLEVENTKLRDINDKLDKIHNLVNGPVTALKQYVAVLTKQISILLPESDRARFAADLAQAEAHKAEEQAGKP